MIYTFEDKETLEQFELNMSYVELLIFLEENKNGFEFDAQDIASLKQVLKKIMHSSESELLLMAEESHHMAQNITKEIWVKTLFEMINVKQKILRNP